MKMARWSPCITVVLAGLLQGPARAADAPGTWSMAAPMKVARAEMGVASVGGKIYVIGGEAEGKTDSPLVQEFDPAAGRWRDLAPMPRGASHLGVAAIGDRLYVAGGFTANVHKNPLAQFLEYDIATDRWRTLAPLPQPLGSVNLVALAGQIHAIAGRGADGKTVGLHTVYDPATAKWTTAAPLPVARDHLGIAVVDGWIHVFGGRTNATTDNAALNDIYDPSTDVWHTLAPMPTARSSGAAVLYHGLTLYAGGECKNPATRATFDENEAYDTKSDRWLTLAPLPTGLHAFVAAAAGDAAYFIGGNAGCGGDVPSNAVYVFRRP
jgi:N-acetylneuraminic acid mutarotase